MTCTLSFFAVETPDPMSPRYSAISSSAAPKDDAMWTSTRNYCVAVLGFSTAKPKVKW